MENIDKKNTKMPEVDFFRDTWVRYVGYANEVGEAFRPVIPRFLVNFSYKVAFTYVFADTLTKSCKMMVKERNPTKVLVTAGDSLIWHTLASIAIPGFTINRISAFSLYALGRYAKVVPLKIRSGLTVFIGLGSIPLIVHPIDAGTTAFMNATYRPFFRI